MQETWFDPWDGPWRREWLPTPVLWPGEIHGLYSPWGRKESDMTEWLSLSFSCGFTYTLRSVIIEILFPFMPFLLAPKPQGYLPPLGYFHKSQHLICRKLDSLPSFSNLPFLLCSHHSVSTLWASLTPNCCLIPTITHLVRDTLFFETSWIHPLLCTSFAFLADVDITSHLDYYSWSPK